MKLLNRVFIFAIILYVSGCVYLKQGTSEDKENRMEKWVESTLKQMTLEEKLDYIGGDRDFYIRPIERLGIPEIKMSDGPMGVRNYGPATAYPGGIALAATWNLERAADFGRAAGRDARARGVHIWLAPGVNIYRYPLCGRNFEYYGEDPYLASCITAEVIKNFQAQGALATVKHYACNNNEYGRMTFSSEVDERTLYEIYLPAFRAAVVEGNVGCVMSAYNLVNGTYCTANVMLNNEILKEEWGFEGILMSDWGATHDAVGAANGGLDLEMPSGLYMNRANLIPAIKEGIVSEKTIDDKVRRILSTIYRAGFLDRAQLDESIPLDNPKNARVALDMARESIVLLKNEQSLLPLDKSTIRSIAVIGPNSHPAVHGGGGSSFTEPFRAISVLDGIRQMVGESVEVLHDPTQPWLDMDALLAATYEHVASDGSIKPGLVYEYFDNKNLTGEPIKNGVTEKISFDWGKGSPEGLPAQKFSARWTGRIITERAGRYLFVTRTDDGVRVYLDDKLIIDDWGDHAVRALSFMQELDAGKTYNLKVEYYENSGDAVAQFGWRYLEPIEETEAVKKAEQADVAIVCVGFTPQYESEGSDRSFVLPGQQAALIKAIAKVNSRTIVVLNSGGSVLWNDWLEEVPALLQAWYPGQEGGTAVAEIIFGNVTPSGKLPATFEKKLEDNPAHPYYQSEDGRTCPYTEGLFVGYRGFDHYAIEPQFCFGYGLSYTTFEYSELRISPPMPTSDEQIAVSFTIKNTGAREGAEIAQVYVRDLKSLEPRPPHELKGFKKVFLKPGESQNICIELGKDALSYYDPDKHTWVVEPGTFEIQVGASSRDIRLKGFVDVQ